MSDTNWVIRGGTAGGFDVVLDLVGKQLEVEEGRKMFLIEVIKKEQKQDK